MTAFRLEWRRILLYGALRKPPAAQDVGRPCSETPASQGARSEEETGKVNGGKAPNLVLHESMTLEGGHSVDHSGLPIPHASTS